MNLGTELGAGEWILSNWNDPRPKNGIRSQSKKIFTKKTKFRPSVTKEHLCMFSLPKLSIPSSTTLPLLYQVVQTTLKTILNSNAFEISWCKTEKVWKVYFSKTIEWHEKGKWKFNTFVKVYYASVRTECK